MPIERTPIGVIASLAASAEKIAGDVTLYRLETLAVTTRVTYHASATAAIRLKLYFSPDGRNYDTVDYAYFDIDLDAGETVQETKLVDSPEGGNLRAAVENLDAVYEANAISVWVGVVKE